MRWFALLRISNVYIYFRAYWKQIGFKKVFINAEVLEESGEFWSYEEGCLSIPGKTFTVKRYKKIHLSYFNRKGEYISEEVSGFKAIIVQHEYDHLNGVMLVDFIEQMLSEINFSKYATAPLM